MRKNCSSILLAGVLIFAFGCREKRTTLSPEISETHGSFDISQAMTMLYGNFDPKKQASTASIPKGNDGNSTRSSEEEMTIRPLFHALSGVDGAQTFVLLTYAVPRGDETYYCHSCAPTIGMAVFLQEGLKWKMDAANRAAADAGEFGKPPTDIELVQIGPKHQAAKISSVGGGQGETTAVLLILVPWDGTVNLSLERIVADDNKGSCGPKASLPCYANRRSVNFLRDDAAEYYQLALTLTGTDLEDSDAPSSTRARKVHGLETLKFENGKYVQVSRHGDLTSLDRDVAEREGLK